MTLEEGTLVPKKFRVSKIALQSCSKCLIQFESPEVMQMHRNCHFHSEMPIRKITGNNGTAESLSRGGESMNEAGVSEKVRKTNFKCPMCGPMNKINEEKHQHSESQYFVKWNSCATHLWKEHQVDCELYTCSVCKVCNTSSTFVQYIFV